MTGELFGVAVFCITGAALSLVLRQYRPEYAVLVSLGCSVVVLLWVITGVAQVMDELNSLLENSLLSRELVQVVMKCLGVCILTELAAQTCRDAGENAIAAKAELAGKVTLVLVSLPLFQRLLQVAGELLEIS
ncbi:MAG: stage III sporulation protein AD [Angelakisella sp.]|jgi:stage III sporulation protein AD|nr:stage III sporulation protein AD [Angelakisella sp.]